jgi:hypothetical protein
MLTINTRNTAGPLFRRALPLPWDPLFEAPCDNERPTMDYGANLVDHLHDIHNYAQQHFKLGSDKMKTRYDRLWTRFGLLFGYTEHLQNVTTSNYSAINNSYTPQFTTALTKSSVSAVSSPVILW